VEKINGLIAETDLSNIKLENINKKTAHDKSNTAIFNNAAQVWNPIGAIADKIHSDFGNHENLNEELKKAAVSRFGNGWAWLVLKDEKQKNNKKLKCRYNCRKRFKDVVNNRCLGTRLLSGLSK
jgi:Fe-Mn family superoxide dismutase